MLIKSSPSLIAQKLSFVFAMHTYVNALFFDFTAPFHPLINLSFMNAMESPITREHSMEAIIPLVAVIPMPAMTMVAAGICITIDAFQASL